MQMCSTGERARIGYLTVCPQGKFTCFFVVCCCIFKSTLRKIVSVISSECQKDWIQIRPDILSGLILVQFVCKGYEQTTLEDKELIHRHIVSLYIHTQLTSRINCLNCGLVLFLRPYFVCASPKSCLWNTVYMSPRGLS